MSIETSEIAVGEFTFTADMAGPADGSPVLVRHGLPETRHMWRRQVAALGAAGYRAVAPDQRGYARGARPNDVADYATDRLVADAIGIMAALGHACWHQVGHDWGAQLSWLIASTYAPKLLSLNKQTRPQPATNEQTMKEDTAQASRSGHH